MYVFVLQLSPPIQSLSTYTFTIEQCDEHKRYDPFAATHMMESDDIYDAAEQEWNGYKVSLFPLLHFINWAPFFLPS